MATDTSSKARRVIGAATTGPHKIAKAVGRIASSSIHKGVQAVFINARPLDTINEPHTGELTSTLEQFHAPSLNISIHETVCSSNPPSFPNRRVSMDTSTVKKLSEIKNAGEDNTQTLKSTDDIIFDRFSDDTIACAKAPPSKPFKRASMDSGFRDSMTSTVSAMTMDTGLASELKLKGSFVSVDEDVFCLDLEDSFISRV